MKMSHRSVFGCALAALLSLGLVGHASAQGFSVRITVDENGNGRLTNTNGSNSPLPASLALDLGPGGSAAALTYGLLNPPGLVSGDLLLTEFGGEEVTDWIRFNPNGTLVFYSDTGDGVDSLADQSAFPPEAYTNVRFVDEVGSEGVNGLVYTPIAGEPGFVAGAQGPVTYDIISDGTIVPEPGSLALLATGGMPLLGFLRRRRAAA
jgi:hypothetical protein